jgi:NAD(P)-dependent dehydrogenase (short-subunit alcohol dehydrogenase family)
MKNKIAIITGGATGIGKATALEFAYHGVHVVLADINEEEASKTCQQIKNLGVKTLYIHCHVEKPEDHKIVVEKTMETFGAIHYAFNNAGIGGQPGNIHEQTIENWNHVIDVNLNGIFYGMHYQVPAILSSGGGAIVNCSSILGHVGFGGSAAYVASKHGVLGLTKAAALEYATQGIRVNAICPGFIVTPLLEKSGITSSEETRKFFEAKHALNRLGSPEEIATCVRFLCSDEASFVTGHAFVADGGYIIQ